MLKNSVKAIGWRKTKRYSNNDFCLKIFCVKRDDHSLKLSERSPCVFQFGVSLFVRNGSGQMEHGRSIYGDKAKLGESYCDLYSGLHLPDSRLLSTLWFCVHLNE